MEPTEKVDHLEWEVPVSRCRLVVIPLLTIMPRVVISRCHHSSKESSSSGRGIRTRRRTQTFAANQATSTTIRVVGAAEVAMQTTIEVQVDKTIPTAILTTRR